MNDTPNTSPQGWERPVNPPEIKANRSEEDIRQWWMLLDRVIEVAAANGYSKAEVARRIGMNDGKFSQWFSGKYDGRFDTTNGEVRKWVDQVQDTASLASSVPSSPPFIMTRSAAETVATLEWSQITSSVVIITQESGIGKTMACRHYLETRPRVYMATISPHTRTVHGMLIELAASLDILVANPAKLTRAIGTKLASSRGNTLLIIDEAQNLVVDAINQVRHFSDEYKCGVALVGNSEIYTRIKARGDGDGPTYGQIKRRVSKRLTRRNPYPEDIAKFIEAWGVTDPACVQELTGIGRKAGALGQIDETVKIATMYALGAREPLGIKHIKAAWKNRDVEDWS